MSGMSDEQLAGLLDGVDQVTELFNGIKTRLVNLGWDERMAEQASIAAFVASMSGGRKGAGHRTVACARDAAKRSFQTIEKRGHSTAATRAPEHHRMADANGAHSTGKGTVRHRSSAATSASKKQTTWSRAKPTRERTRTGARAVRSTSATATTKRKPEWGTSSTWPRYRKSVTGSTNLKQKPNKSATSKTTSPSSRT